MPPICELDVSGGRSWLVLRCPRARERRGAHDAVVLEVQEQPVAAGAGHLGAEHDVGPGLGLAVAGRAVGVHVQVGEVAVAQRDQVPVGAEVGLQVGDRLAVPADRQRQLDVLAGARSPVEGDAVAVDRGGAARRRAARAGSRRRPRGRRRGSAPSRPGRHEVGEDPPGARRQVEAVRPGAVGVQHGWTCWKPVRSRRTTIRCSSFSCSTSYVRDRVRRPGRRSRTRPVRRAPAPRSASASAQRVAALGHHQPARDRPGPPVSAPPSWPPSLVRAVVPSCSSSWLTGSVGDRADGVADAEARRRRRRPGRRGSRRPSAGSVLTRAGSRPPRRRRGRRRRRGAGCW